MKKVKITIITLLSLFLFVSQINCAEKTTYKVVCSTYKKDGNCADDRTVDRTITGNDPDNPGYGGAYKITLEDESGNRKTAYCTDPYVDGAVGTGTTYVESKINEQDAAAYQSIFNQTCGDEQMQTAAIKTYIATSGREYMGNNATTKEAYSNVMNKDSTSYKNSATETKKLQGVVSDAQNAANNAKGSSKGGVQVNANGDTAVISGETGSFSVSRSDICTETTSGNKTTYRCSIKSICDTAMNPESIKEQIGVTTNNGSGGATPESNNCKPCTPKMYTVSSGTGGGVQRFIACIDEGTGYSRGADTSKDKLPSGAVPGDGGTTEMVDLTCEETDTWDDDCSIPCDMTFNEPFENEGSEICNATGAVVVDLSEYGYSSSYEDTFCCVKNAAESGINDTVIADKTILKDGVTMCHAYCTDKSYELTLPGPTSDSLNQEVLVNAGTFFNIDGTMKSKSNIECYVTADYKALVTSVNSLRTTMANAVTNLNMYKAYRDSVSSYLNHKVAHDHYDTVYYDCCSSGYTLTGGRCVKETVQEDGTVSTSTRSVSTCEKQVYSHTTYTYYGDYTIPSYETVSLNPTGENGGFYSTYTEPSNYQTCNLTEEEYNNNRFCQDNLNLRKDIDRKISDAQEAVEKAKKNLDPNNTSGILNGYLKEWDYCLGGGKYESQGWSFSKFDAKVKNQENCHTKIEFTYEDGEYLGLTPITLNATVDTNPSTVKKNIESGGTDKRNLKIGDCSESGSCSEATTEVPYTDDFTYATNEITTTYTLPNRFCSPYNESEQVYYLGTQPDTACNGVVMEGFPISLETPQGEYSYRFDYRGIGYHYDNGGSACVGRLEPFISASTNDYDNTCKYNVNNCRACGVECVDKGTGSVQCNIEFDGDCKAQCKISCVGGGCILDYNAGFLATYRTMSLNNPFPNGIASLTPNPLLLAYADVKPSSTRKFPGSNWNTNKAKKVVIPAIEGSGENIYKEDPDYAITLDPATIQDIRQYNKDNPDYFSKGTLICHEHSKVPYSVCESEFVLEYFDKHDNEGWNEYYKGDYKNELFTGPALK